MKSRLFINAPVEFGRGSLAQLRKLNGRRAAIITDDVAMAELGFLEQTMELLKTANLDAHVLARISREPTTDDIDEIRPKMIDFEPDWIIALGGGSVLDSAKALWVFREHPNLSWDEAFQFNGLPPINNTRLVAVPSTSGTGSETSRVSVVVDSKSGLKRLLISPEIIPTLAIVDSMLPEKMPPWLTAASAFDALSHAIESSIAIISNEFSISLALGATRLIFEHLQAAYHNDDHHAREQLHYAATIAGMAINNSTAGLAHAMDQVGPLFSVPHGVVCAVLLPYTMGFLFDSSTHIFAKMGQAVGLCGSNEIELAEAFLREFVSLKARVKVPSCFKEMGIQEEAFMNQLDIMVEAAEVSGSTHLSPRIPVVDEFHELYLNAYHGRLPEVFAL